MGEPAEWCVSTAQRNYNRTHPCASPEPAPPRLTGVADQHGALQPPAQQQYAHKAASLGALQARNEG